MDIQYCKRVDGKGLFSTKCYSKDDVIYILEGDIKVIPDKYTIQVDKNRHITDKYGIYMNHSFNPSVRIEGNNVIAINDIQIGDEICFNYNDSESVMASPFYADGKLVSGKNDKSIRERFKIKSDNNSTNINNIETIINFMTS